MLFVELGREVSPLNLKCRGHKAVITGIKDNKFVVVLKQDKTYEVVRLKDVVLNDKVYDLEELKDQSHEFFNSIPVEKIGSDFERFIIKLKSKVEKEVLEHRLSKN